MARTNRKSVGNFFSLTRVEILRRDFSWQENQKLPRPKAEGEIKRVATAREPPAIIPVVVVVVDVHVTLVVPAIECGLYGAPSVPPPFEYSRG